MSETSNGARLIYRRAEQPPQLQQQVGIIMVTLETLWETWGPKDKNTPPLFLQKLDQLNEIDAQ